jgi:hypothetical protein
MDEPLKRNGARQGAESYELRSSTTSALCAQGAARSTLQVVIRNQSRAEGDR